MRSLLIAICASIALLGGVACHKEAPLKPSTVTEFYTLPQGNHPYDDSIVAFYQRYGSYILYKFDTVDYAYNYTSYLSIKAAQGNEAYVPQTLDYFRKNCMDLYPENFLKSTMPFKIILAAYIDTLNHADVDTYFRSVSGFMSGRGTLIIGWTDSTLQQQPAAKLKLMKGYLHRFYFWQALQSGALQIPAAFASFAPAAGYQTRYPVPQPAAGIIEATSNTDATRYGSLTWDFLCYINVITSHTKAELDASILKPSYDTKGLIQKKYNALISYYQTTYGMDLQAVGEHP